MNNKILIIGIIVLLVVGIVTVFAMGDKWHGDKSWKKGWHYKEVGDKSAWFEKFGISPDATKEEMMEAVHVGAAIESGATLVHAVQMMNKVNKLDG